MISFSVGEQGALKMPIRRLCSRHLLFAHPLLHALSILEKISDYDIRTDKPRTEAIKK
jgi:hypothetical protein